MVVFFHTMYALIPKTCSIRYQSMFNKVTAKMVIGHTYGILVGRTMQCAWYHKRGIYPESIRQSRRVKEKKTRHNKAKKTIKLFKQPLKGIPVAHLSKVSMS